MVHQIAAADTSELIADGAGAGAIVWTKCDKYIDNYSYMTINSIDICASRAC